MNFQSDICVVGDGAIGKALAIGLSQLGYSVTLLRPASRAPQSQAAWDTRVYALNHAARDLLSGLRVWEAMDHGRIAPVDAMLVHGDSAHAGKIEFDAWNARSSELAWIVEDSNLEQAMDGALRYAQRLQQAQGRATRVLQQADGVELQLENGDLIRARLLIGADGRHSWVRAQCDIGMTYRDYHQRGVVCNFDCELPHHGRAQQWFLGRDGIVALLPLPERRLSLVWSAPNALAEQLLNEPLTELARRLSDLPGQLAGRLTPLQPESIQAIPLLFIRAQSMIAQRVLLAGDAAHGVHPLAGHGMNLGFGDVAAIFKLFDSEEARADCGDDRLLRRYARARREDVLLMQMATDGLERLFATEIEPLRIARNLGMDVLNRLPFIKRRLIAHAMGLASF